MPIKNVDLRNYFDLTEDENLTTGMKAPAGV